MIERCFDLRDFIDLRFSSKVIDHTQNKENVDITVSCPEGEYSLRSRYMAACDGADSPTRKRMNLSFDGEIKMGVPEIEKVGDTYTPFITDKSFDGLKLIGSRGKPLEIKPPRNQISFGPMVGVTYNQVTGLTEPIWGFGITYNLVKLRDWR